MKQKKADIRAYDIHICQIRRSKEHKYVCAYEYDVANRDDSLFPIDIS